MTTPMDSRQKALEALDKLKTHAMFDAPDHLCHRWSDIIRAALTEKPALTETPTIRDEAERRVLEVRGSYDAPGFDACVDAEIKAMTETPSLDVEEIRRLVCKDTGIIHVGDVEDILKSLASRNLLVSAKVKK